MSTQNKAPTGLGSAAGAGVGFSLHPSHLPDAGQWERVSKARPCPVCGKSDWCLTKYTGGVAVAAICPRTPNEHPVGDRGAGYLHQLADDPLQRPRRVSRRIRHDSAPDFSKWASRLRLPADSRKLVDLARDLPGTTPGALHRLGCGWSVTQGAAVFPMSDSAGHIIGLRYRRADGAKWAARGSRNGLFLPEGIRPHAPLFLPEGATDTAAVLSVGLQAAGRPSCNGGAGLVCDLVRRLQPRRVLVVADQDEPGQRGARDLARRLVGLVPVAIWTPPGGRHKDVRAYAADAPAQAAAELLSESWR